MADVLVGFLRRDWLVWSSYRFNALAQLGGILILISLLAMVGDSALTLNADALDHSPDWVAFVLAGVAFSDLFFGALTGPPRAMRDGQLSGTIEPILLTPISTVQLVTSSCAFTLAQSLLRAVLIVAVAMVALEYWQEPNVLAAMLVIVTAWLAFFGLGLLATSFVVVLKQGDPVIVGYVAVSAVLGGAVVPVDALPGWIRPMGDLLPLTHGLDGVRAALAGSPTRDVVPSLAVLAVSAGVLVPAGLVSVRWALHHARREGTLVQY